MLNSIIEFSIRHKLLIGLITVVFIIYGSYQVTKLPIDAVPDITDNQVQIITVAPSYGAIDIERLLTYPIEQSSSNIPGIKEIRSFSRFGLSLVTIVFKDEVDVYWARQQVAERIQQIQGILPPGMGTPELGPVSTGLGEIYQYVVKAAKSYESKYGPTELRTIQDWIVRRQLLGVEGVAEVSSFGGKVKQFHVAISPDKLNSISLSLEDVFNAIESNNGNTGGSYIDKGPTIQYIRSEGLITSKSDIENIVVRSLKTGESYFIRDIAQVELGTATRYGAMCMEGSGEVSGAVVMMLKGANSNQVIKNIKEKIESIRKTLPEGVEIEPFLDRTKMVNNAISTVEKNLMEGALIVVFILVVFLGNLRAGLLVASVIPLSMLFAISMMNYFGVSGNLMSLGALDFGLIVDGAVIIVEAVLHQLHINSSLKSVHVVHHQDLDKTIEHTTKKMMNSAVFGQVIILIVYLPILTLQGVEGNMFRPMAQTVSFALLGAFLLSLTYIPMMSSLILKQEGAQKKNLSDIVFEKLSKLYRQSLEYAIRYSKWIVAFVLFSFAVSIFVMLKLGGECILELE